MVKNLLLPAPFHRLGWVVLLPSALLGLTMLFDVADAVSWSGLPETVLNNAALVGTAVGLLFVGFARVRGEDEYVTALRLQALAAAVYANCAALVALALALYGVGFLTAVFILLYTLPLLYYLIFRIRLWRARKEVCDEE